MAGVVFYPKFKAWDGASPAVSGTVTFYEPGSSVTKKDIYDEDGNAVANPYTLDANGEAELYGEGAYHIVVKDASSNELLNMDNVFFDAWAVGEQLLTTAAGQSTDTVSTGLNTDNLDFGGTVTTDSSTLSIVAMQNVDDYRCTIYENNSNTAITFGTAPSTTGQIKIYNVCSSGSEVATVRWWARVRA